MGRASVQVFQIGLRGVLVHGIPDVQEEIMKLTLIADHAEVVRADTDKHLAAREWLRMYNKPYGTIYAAE